MPADRAEILAVLASDADEVVSGETDSGGSVRGGTDDGGTTQ